MLDAIVCDEGVLSGLNAAYVLRNAVYKDKPPTELLHQLKQGPGRHIKTHSYAYRDKVQREIARLKRIRLLQERIVGLAGTLILSASVGVANLSEMSELSRRRSTRLGVHTESYQNSS